FVCPAFAICHIIPPAITHLRAPGRRSCPYKSFSGGLPMQSIESKSADRVNASCSSAHFARIAVKFFSLALLALFFAARPVLAQDVTGDWLGAVHFNGTDHRVVLHITGTTGALRASLDLPDDFN